MKKKSIPKEPDQEELELRKGMGLLDNNEEEDEPVAMMTRKKVGKGERKTRKPLNSQLPEEEEKEEVMREEPKIDPYKLAEQIRLENEQIQK